MRVKHILGGVVVPTSAQVAAPAQVYQLDALLALGQQDVIGLHISMDDARGMHGREAFGDFFDELAVDGSLALGGWQVGELIGLKQILLKVVGPRASVAEASDGLSALILPDDPTGASLIVEHFALGPFAELRAAGPAKGGTEARGGAAAVMAEHALGHPGLFFAKGIRDLDCDLTTSGEFKGGEDDTKGALTKKSEESVA